MGKYVAYSTNSLHFCQNGPLVLSVAQRACKYTVYWLRDTAIEKAMMNIQSCSRPWLFEVVLEFELMIV